MIPVAGSVERPWALRTRRVSWAAASAHTPSVRNRSLPRAHRLPCPEVDRQRPPRAARMLQVETGVDHLAQIGGEGEVVLEQGLDDIPFRVRQVARIASPISLVFFSVLVCPHPNLLLAAFNSQQGKSVKQALSGASG